MSRSIAELTLLIEKDPLNLELRLERGRILRTQGQYIDSITDYDFIIEKDPKYPQAHYERGFSKYLLGRFEESLEDLQEAIDLNSKNADAYFIRSVIMTKSERPSKAIDGFDKVIELDPKDAEAYYNRGLAKAALDEHESAIVDFNEAIEIDPKYSEAYNAKGYSQFKLKEYQKASVNFEKAIDIDGDYFDGHLNYGECLVKIGNRKAAIEQFIIAKKLDPERYNREELDDLLYEGRQLEEFLSIFKKLKDGFQQSENNWFIASIFIVVATLIIFLCMIFHPNQSKNIYFLYVFLSVITAIVIRQYTNAKNHRIEADNRLAMAKLFENLRYSEVDNYEKFIEPIIRSLVYSMKVNTNQESANIRAKIQDLISK